MKDDLVRGKFAELQIETLVLLHPNCINAHHVFYTVLLSILQANANVADLAKRLKQAEAANGELARRVDELTGDLHNAQAENGRLAADNARLKQLVGDLEARNDTLARENKNLSGRNLESE